MPKSNPNSKVDFYFDKAKEWQEEIIHLRSIILDCGLDETLKWGCPCYTYEDSNIVLIHVFKSYCAVLFFKGALLKDDKNMLVQQTKNVQAARQARFTNVDEIKKSKTTLKALIKQAMEAEKAGLKIDMKKTSEFAMPEEFKHALDANPKLGKAFKLLTPGRQRGYLLYFSQPKQSATRVARIEKFTQHIIDGKGLND